MQNKKWLPLLMTPLLLSACQKPQALVPLTPYEKQSPEMLLFKSDDDDLDLFLNDFFKRHMGYVDENGIDYAVTTLKPGKNTTNAFYQEWMSLALYWFNSFDGLETDRLTGLKSRLSSLPVDDYGCVWQEDDAIRINMGPEYDGLHRMGWPFPYSGNTQGKSTSWLFNGDQSEGKWSSNIDANLDKRKGLFYGSTDVGMSSIIFESPTLSAYNSIYTYYAPYLELDLRMFIHNYEDIDDVYVWFTNERNEDYSLAKCVAAKDICAINYPFTANYQHLLVYPMYAHESWKSTENKEIFKIKVEIRAKEGKTLSGSVGMNSVRCLFDTRHANNNGLFLAALKNDFAFTGDLPFIRANLTRARKAMNFYMQMYNPERHLIYSSYLVGHDGDKTDDHIVIRTASSLGNGYWDASYTPEYDFQTNMHFYKGLVAMAYLENLAETFNINIDKEEATIKTANRYTGFSNATYDYDSASLTALAAQVKTALQAEKNDAEMTGFYNPQTGRFGMGHDINTGYFYDFGYIAHNEEAVFLGIPTKAQEKSIMAWINGDRIVKSDLKDENGQGNGKAGTDGVGGSTGEDIYHFEFAPRVNTVNQKKPSLFSGQYESESGFGDEFGRDQVQFGGAMLWVSFYDLMARINHFGPDNAFERLQGIQKWYRRIYDYSTHPNRDYRKGSPEYYSYIYYDYYADHTDLLLQGGRYGTSTKGGCNKGLLGIDSEFIESIIMMAAVPLGFFGLSSQDGKTLQVAPRMPRDLNYWKLENLAFNRVKYDLTIQYNNLRIDSVRGDASGLMVNVALDIKKSNPMVYINGIATDNFEIIDGKIHLLVPLSDVVIEVR